MATLTDHYDSMLPTIQNGGTFEDWYHQYYTDNPNSLPERIGNWFSGNIDAARERFQNLYDSWSLDKQQKYEYELQRSLRSTEYQDAIKSMQAAGLNPYVVLSGGNGSVGGNYSTSTSARTYSNGKTEGSKRGLAALVYMIGRIIATIL